MSITIIQQHKTDVKNIEAGVFSLVGKKVALQECNNARPISPPIGESTSAFILPSNTSMGGSNAENSPRNLSEGQPYFDVPTSLDSSKQVGIQYADLFRSVVRDESLGWLQRHEELREQRIKIADVLYKSGRLKEANAIRYCGENFVAYVAECCGETFAQPVSCGHRLCPVCMRRRSAKLAGRLEKIISGAFFKWKEKINGKILEKKGFIKMKNPKHIVLTLKNEPRITKFYIKRIRGYFEKLRHRDIFSGCDGGFYSIETTYNDEKKTWHVHIHVVADVPYIPQDKLSEVWEKISGSYIVHIEQVGGSGQSAMEASKEIAKYVVKPGEFMGDPDLVNEYLDAVKGLRLVSTFGYYYGKELEEEEGSPDCGCGKNQWRKLDGFYPIDCIFKDTMGFYRLRTFVSDG